MTTLLDEILNERLTELRETGRFKVAPHLAGPQQAEVTLDDRATIMLSSNNYLGLSNHPVVVAGAKAAVDQYGQGTSSVRFICGTMTCHLDLERTICEFIECEAAVTYISCWDANVGLIPTLAATAEDAIFSDALNHASIIDAIRLSKAQRNIYPHGDLKRLEEMLKASDARIKLIVTDGVFSMEGDIADLPALKELADTHSAVLVVDESHATGVLGTRGRGTAEHFGVLGEGTIQTSTLGKALGGACGGYVAATRPVCDYLLQNSRPHLFSNALPPAVCGGAMAAIGVLRDEPERLARLAENAMVFREKVGALGLTVLPGETPIVPVMVGDEALANRAQRRLHELGVYVSGFGFPVVPRGEARLRCQVSAGHTMEQLDRAVAAFKTVGDELGLLK
jgi:glycine C-acetyltransferase